MSDPDDYESLPATASLSVTCFAGALAGIAEHCVMFPIDSVKVSRAQEWERKSGTVDLTLS